MPSGAMAMAPRGGRRVWAMMKLYAALRDLPEVVPLFAVVGATVGLSFWTVWRQQFSLAGDNYVSPAIRGDMERQARYSELHQDIEPHILWKIAQWRVNKDDGTINVAVWPFKNQAWKYDHIDAASAKGVEPTDRPKQERGSKQPMEM